MASRITERGARLHELLRREAEGGVRAAREGALALLERLSGSLLGGGGAAGRAALDAFERALRDAIGAAKDGAAALEREAAELAEDERTLAAKLKKKRAELGRAQKRLASLRGVRPAFMDEYERLERELEAEHEGFVTRARNLDALSRALAAAEAEEREAAADGAAKLARLQRSLRDADAAVVRGDEAGGGGGGGGGAPEPAQPQQQRPAQAAPAPAAAPPRAAAAAAARAPLRGGAAVSGRLDADDDDDSSVDSADGGGDTDDDGGSLGGLDDF